MLYEHSMKWSDVAILVFNFLSRDNCRLAQWAWLKVRHIDALHANRRIFIIYIIDDVDESLQP